MAQVAIQKGHVPRTRGATGTVGEQQFTNALGDLMQQLLVADGHTVDMLLADPPGRRYPEGDIFIALHNDGSVNRSAHGTSGFFARTYEWSAESQRRGAEYLDKWVGHHTDIADYPWRYRGTNYLGAAVAEDFYAWRAPRVAAGQAVRSSIAVLVEHFFSTTPSEWNWSRDGGRFRAMAEAHRRAINEMFGTPTPPTHKGDTTMIGFFRRKGLPGVFACFSDGTKLWVQTPSMLTHMQNIYGFRGVSRDVTVIHSNSEFKALGHVRPGTPRPTGTNRWGNAKPV